MSILGLILAVAAGCGAVVGMRMSKAGSKQGALLAVPCAILAVILAVGGLLNPRDSTPKLAKSLNQYGLACGVSLGKHLAELHAGSRVLLLVEPTFAGREPDMLQVAIEEGLKAGIGGELEWAGTVPLDPPQSFLDRAKKVLLSQSESGNLPDWTMPFEMQNHEMWYTPDYLAWLLDQHQGNFDVLVCAAGLPRDFDRSPLIQDPDLPQTIAVLNAHGVPLKRLTKSGVIDALVMVKPSANPWKAAMAAPKDLAEAFDKRYLLVTAENVEELAAAYPEAPNLR